MKITKGRIKRITRVVALALALVLVSLPATSVYAQSFQVTVPAHQGLYRSAIKEKKDSADYVSIKISSMTHTDKLLAHVEDENGRDISQEYEVPVNRATFLYFARTGYANPGQKVRVILRNYYDNNNKVTVIGDIHWH